MEYLKIQNKGVLDKRLITLIGGSTKGNDSTKIGVFGTGLKYAIVFFIRNNIKFHIFAGEKEIVVTTKDRVIKDKLFTEVLIDNKSTNITLNYGFQWRTWEAIREIYCNAIDEKFIGKSIVEDVDIKGDKGTTSIYIEITNDIKEVIDDWDKYFITEEVPIFSNDKVSIYHNNNEDKKLRIYKNNILIHINPYYKSIFRYDFKEAPLNELRQYMGSYSYSIPEAILSSNKRVVSILLREFNNYYLNMENNKLENDYIEIKHTDYKFPTNDPVIIKDIFGGYLFIDERSSNKVTNAHIIKVSSSLFSVLEAAELPVEKLNISSRGYYGGSSYSNNEIIYKDFENPILTDRIEDILHEFSIAIQFTIGASSNKDFEFIIDDNKVVFNSNLDCVTDEELKSIVLLSYFSKHNVVYSTLKELLKETIKYNTLSKYIQ